MQVLRDLRAFTKLLILLEIKKQPRLKLRDLAMKLDVTVQGVSEYFKLMTNERLIERIAGEQRVTQNGVEFLHKNMTGLKKFIDENMHDLDIINVCTAFAAENLNSGDKVGLVMQNGELSAGKKLASRSKGTVLYQVKKGDEVAIFNLEGIIEFDYGKLTIIELPSSMSGGSIMVDNGKVHHFIKNKSNFKIAVFDLVGLNIIKKLNFQPDIQFSVFSGTIEAMQKGLNVILLITSDSLPNIISELEKLNSRTKEKLSYDIISQEEILKQ